MNNYYFDYLLKSEKFPQSFYHRAKKKMVSDVFATLPKGTKVLDAGCGSGYLAAPYTKNYKIFGVDKEKESVDYCKAHWQGKYQLANLDKLPFTDNYFDAILFLDTIEHLKTPLKTLKELNRVLKPKGRVLICTINYDNFLWFILENTWHRLTGGNCRTYSKDVHPTRYGTKLLDAHATTYFKKNYLKAGAAKMELFFLGSKKGKKSSGLDFI